MTWTSNTHITVSDLRRTSKTGELPGRWSAMCPLECGDISLILTDGEYVFDEHKGTHPQSTGCYWSTKPAPYGLRVYLTSFNHLRRKV